MGGGGKGGGSEVKIPKYLQEFQKSNIGRAEDMAGLGYQPWTGPDVAAVNPWEELGASQQNQMSDAFGLGTVDGTIASRMPETVNMGGVEGYSSYPMFQQNVENQQAVNPGFDAAYKEQFGMTPDQQVYGQLPQQNPGVDQFNQFQQHQGGGMTPTNIDMTPPNQQQSMNPFQNMSEEQRMRFLQMLTQGQGLLGRLS